MTQFKSDFLRTLSERGFIHQSTDPEGLDKLALSAPITGYIGFDCTAPSLHVGSLVQIMMLRWLQKTGHRPIVLFGGGTTKVGDPSGRDESRRLLTDQDIANNMAGIRSVFEMFLTFGDGESDAIAVNNADWLDGLEYIAFLRDVGRHFTINRMLTFDSVRLRLDREQPLTFLEFNYMILQAYDFVELAKRHDCSVQMGGSDQWGNIVNGIELGRRLADRSLFGITTPLITTADGSKMGKTAQGAIWLNEKDLSSYDYWQFWRNTQDADVGRFLRLFTELPLSEIERLESLQGAELNEAKKILADEATALCRGKLAAQKAAETARKTFEEQSAGEGLPRVSVDSDRLADGIAAFDLFVEAGLSKSKKEARRLIEQGGARIDDQRIGAVDHMIRAADFGETGQIKISAGRKRHALLVRD